MGIDYHNFSNKDTPKKERERLCIGDIWINAAKCLNCGEFIRSTNKHDLKKCSCGNISVDGGSHYVKRSIIDPHTFINIIEYFNDIEINDVEK
jgi:hypothetical protein